MEDSSKLTPACNKALKYINIANQKPLNFIERYKLNKSSYQCAEDTANIFYEQNPDNKKTIEKSLDILQRAGAETGNYKPLDFAASHMVIFSKKGCEPFKAGSQCTGGGMRNIETSFNGNDVTTTASMYYSPCFTRLTDIPITIKNGKIENLD